MCSCAGAASEALKQEAWMEDDEGAEARRRGKAMGQAVRAVRQMSAGRSRSEVKATLLDEFARQGFPSPPPDLLEAWTTSIADDVGEKRFAYRTLRALSRMAIGFLRELQPQDRPKGRGHIYMAGDTTRAAFPVMLDPGAQEWFVGLGKRYAERASTSRGRLDVSLRPEPGATGRVVSVYVDQRRLGTLSSEASAEYSDALESAENHTPALTFVIRGTVTQTTEEGWQLAVLPPTPLPPGVWSGF
jgi:hypothetical protein